jgi:threonine dehydrogenase-like Zn-dependent dehydrogenase
MEKMLAAVFHKDKGKDTGKVKLEEVPKPEIEEDNQILIEVKACGICGTDLKILEGGHPANDNTILGHEFSGIVRDVGNQVKDLIIGDKVIVDPNEKCGFCEACRRGLPNLCSHLATGTTFGIFQNGGFANYCVVPRNSIFTIPKEMDLDSAALIEPLSCAIHCHNIADVRESDNVVIIGAGSMGLIIETIIRPHPLKNLICIEPDEWRAQKALELGADYIINPTERNVKGEIEKITNRRGANVIIDAVGISDTFEMAQKIWAHGARLVCFGQDDRAIAHIRPNDIVRYQRQILGSYISSDSSI